MRFKYVDWEMERGGGEEKIEKVSDRKAEIKKGRWTREDDKEDGRIEEGSWRRKEG